MAHTTDMMSGFEPRFRTPEQYIIGITNEIWEQGGVDLIESAYYAGICPVYTPLGTSRTARDVTEGTRATLVEFPDRQLLAEDVIVGGKRPGFYSSHRVRSTATHLGPGRFGPPTGRAIGMLTIADCLCRDNRIVEEWLVRDQAGMALSVGLDPKILGSEIGRSSRQAAAPGAENLLARWTSADGRMIEGDEALARLAIESASQIWTGRDTGAIASRYDRAARFEGPGGSVIYGVHDIVPFLAAIRAAIPDGAFAIHHAIARRDPDHPPRVALRWSYAGRHAGAGRYGMPTLTTLVLLGISHVEFRGDTIKNEWMLVDELSIWAQIAGARG